MQSSNDPLLDTDKLSKLDSKEAALAVIRMMRELAGDIREWMQRTDPDTIAKVLKTAERIERRQKQAQVAELRSLSARASTYKANIVHPFAV